MKKIETRYIVALMAVMVVGFILGGLMHSGVHRYEKLQTPYGEEWYRMNYITGEVEQFNTEYLTWQKREEIIKERELTEEINSITERIAKYAEYGNNLGEFFPKRDLSEEDYQKYIDKRGGIKERLFPLIGELKADERVLRLELEELGK